MSDTKERLAMLQEGQKVMKEKFPEVMDKFMGLAQSVLQEGNLSTKEKELIAVAVAVAIHCET